MARGRGRGSFFNRPLFGVGKPDDAMPTGQPPPLFPPLKFKPVSLPSGKKISYLLNLKQEIRSAIRESAYYIPNVSTKRDIERYTDKYQQMQATEEIEWDRSLFPRELFVEAQKKRKEVEKVVNKEVVEEVVNKEVVEEVVNEEVVNEEVVEEVVNKEVVAEKLKMLEAKEETEEKGEDEESEQEIEDEEEEYDDELEEETDYANNYFDNGENYLDEDDDNDEGYE